MSNISIWICGDQLLESHPALIAAEQTAFKKESTTIVLIESEARRNKRLYQRKKLVLIFSAMRHYAQWLREEGYKVDYIKSGSFREGLWQHVDQQRPQEIITMAAASYEGREFQSTLESELHVPVQLVPNTQFLVGNYNPIPEPEPGKFYVMENFYRAMRRHFDVLMEGEEPVGGRWNFDKANRKKLPAQDKPPDLLSFSSDAVTEEVIAEVAQLPGGLGSAADFDYAVTREQALAALQDFVSNRLGSFGDYEDAMTRRSHALYHSLLSPYLNLGLLEPLEVVRAVEAAFYAGKAPINAAEGFVRQIIGWREFMYWQYWRQMPGMVDKNAWAAERPLPAFFWDGQTDLACLRHALTRALEIGYNHHIERLMLLCNFFMLTGVNPKAVNDWFLSVYVDAYEWVMPPNVIGMGLNADGGLTATKPYIASANYINKMSDHCRDCCFNPKARHGKNACPFNYLYWNFILTHEERLLSNPRTSRQVWGLRHLDAAERRSVKAQAAELLRDLPA